MTSMRTISSNQLQQSQNYAAPAQDGNKSKVIKRIALTALAGIAMTVGVIAGVGCAGVGIYILGSAWLATEAAIATAAVCLPIAYGAGYLSVALCTNPVTALGAAITTPVAITFVAIPLAPAILGAVAGAPGALLAYGGYKLWESLGDQNVTTPAQPSVSEEG